MIGNIKILFKKKANLSTLAMCYEGKNQKPKLHCSSKTGREKQEKWEKVTLQLRRVCKKELVSSVECSHPSKSWAFLLRQIHHIKQCNTSLQKSMLQCYPNLPYQDSNNSMTLCGITQWIPNRQNTKDHNSQAMGQWKRRLSTDYPQLLHI